MIAPVSESQKSADISIAGYYYLVISSTDSVSAPVCCLKWQRLKQWLLVSCCSYVAVRPSKCFVYYADTLMLDCLARFMLKHVDDTVRLLVSQAPIEICKCAMCNLYH